MRVNTRYINSTRGTSYCLAKKKCLEVRSEGVQRGFLSDRKWKLGHSVLMMSLYAFQVPRAFAARFKLCIVRMLVCAGAFGCVCV